jgi:hypothetical protein
MSEPRDGRPEHFEDEGHDMRRFRAARSGGVVVSLDDVDAGILRQLLGELLELLAGEDEPAEADPLAAAVGIGTSTRTPEDPVLARLFPDGYRDDAEAAGEFRRYTELSLREAKQANARAMLAAIDSSTGRLTLDDAQGQAWLTTLNDLRLAIGTRLGVTEEWGEDYEALPEEDPRRYAYAVYDHLTFLQEGLVQALMRAR